MIAQANIGFNRKKGTLRGMHFQYPPAAETKLVRASRGAVLDIIVDLRPESPDLSPAHHGRAQRGQSSRHLHSRALRARLSGAEDNTETTYQVGEFYTPGSEGGLLYNDPALKLEWPLPVTVMSDKDRAVEAARGSRSRN